MTLSPEDIATGKMVFKMVAVGFFALAMFWLLLNLAVEYFDDRD